jgi:hypothetical protein
MTKLISWVPVSQLFLRSALKNPFTDVVEGKHLTYMCRKTWCGRVLANNERRYMKLLLYGILSQICSSVDWKAGPTALCHAFTFPDHCSMLSNSFVKDLGLLGRDLENFIGWEFSVCIYAPAWQCILISTWLGDPLDRKLEQLIPLLEVLATVNSDVRGYIGGLWKNVSWIQPCSAATPGWDHESQIVSRCVPALITAQPTEAGKL